MSKDLKENILNEMDHLFRTDSYEIPPVIPILPLKDLVIFPYMIAPIIITDERNKKLINEASLSNKMIGVFATKEEEEGYVGFQQLYKVGTAALILKMLKIQDGTIRLLLHGLSRIKIKEELSEDPYLSARIQMFKESQPIDTEADALIKSTLNLLQKVITLSSFPSDLAVAAMNIQEPGKLADFIASNIIQKTDEQQEILELFDPKKRLQRILFYLHKEIELLELGSKIQSQVKTEIDKTQKEYYLREQLKAIKKELGEEEKDYTSEIKDLHRLVDEKNLPANVKDVALKEIDKLTYISPASSEYAVSRIYLDWIINLPWTLGSADNLDIKKAYDILEEDHYGLQKVKERIVEYLSVRKLKKDNKGPILCFVGPPGVGKTSLGKSIARALGRKFYRMSLGGLHDEAEIRGHRRTYIGSMPGKIVKGIKTCGTNNPVFMLDEIDKVGKDFRGDPASALLEVLDPEQNFSFTDNYLDLPFDLSNVMFITTANILDTIPPALLDRMEIIELSGYSVGEKLEIVKKYIIEKQIKENGLERSNIFFTKNSLSKMIEEYTRESGLRNVEREIAKASRKVARKIAEGETSKVRITTRNLEKYLGPTRFSSDNVKLMGITGVSIGLAWTPVGGQILFIESSATKGKGTLLLTGQLGDVMKESAQAAFTFLRTRAKKLGIPEDRFGNSDIHIHVPAGAIPKDGPSAGISIATSLASLFSNKPIKDFLAMTGEITLKGKVLSVGGIKEKILAAARAGIKTVILPKRNKNDLTELPQEIMSKLEIRFVEHMDDVLKIALSSKVAM